jgi:hypothetical protein
MNIVARAAPLPRAEPAKPTGEPSAYVVWLNDERRFSPDRFRTLPGAVMHAVRQDHLCCVIALWDGSCWLAGIASVSRGVILDHPRPVWKLYPVRWSCA